MMKVSKVVMVLLAMLLSAGCVKYDINEILVSREDLSLTWKGVDQMDYDPLTWQAGCNVRRYEYRVHDDSMANYFAVRCSERPVAEGQNITADVEWTMTSSIKRYEGIKFSVMKLAPDGRIWLWSRTQQIGIVMKEIEHN
jgi:hypothetical protein